MRRIELRDGAYLELTDDWLTASEADAVFAALMREVAWEARAIRIFGREVMQPRLVSWVGDTDAAYTYSGVRQLPLPWSATLAGLRERLQHELALPFNSVLCNLYRDGADSMGMHSDSEPELGEEPVVASVSLGGVRKLALRHRRDPRTDKLDLPLPHGSLLVMRGRTQHVYRHGIPKLRGVVSPRINLTFRVVKNG